MSRLPDQFLEDRALRNAARDVLMADIEHAKATFSGKGIAARVGGRIGDGAKDVVEVARTNAEDKRGILAILIGAMLMFFAREPILEILGLDDSEADKLTDDNEEAPEKELLDDTASETALATHAVSDADTVGDDDERQ